MALHAIENIGDAFTATREFLFPFELRRWLKLAFVVLFLGGGMSLPTAQFDTPQTVDPSVDLPSIPVETMTIVAAVVGALVFLALLFGLIGAIMEFVFIESLRTGEVTLRQHWGRRWRQGVRLFGFRLLLGLPLFGLVAGWILLLVAPILSPTIDPIVAFGTLLLVGVPLFFLIGLLYALVSSFTTVFVVPIMILTDGGVLASWRLLWGSIRADPKQYLVYAVIAFVLTIATGIAASLVVGLAAVALLLPVVLLGALLYFTVSFSSTAVLLAFAAVVALFLLALVVFWLLVQVPVVAYLRYYALLVLGDIEDTFDLIPEQRTAVRDSR